MSIENIKRHKKKFGANSLANTKFDLVDTSKRSYNHSGKLKINPGGSRR